MMMKILANDEDRLVDAPIVLDTRIRSGRERNFVRVLLVQHPIPSVTKLIHCRGQLFAELIRRRNC